MSSRGHHTPRQNPLSVSTTASASGLLPRPRVWLKALISAAIVLCLVVTALFATGNAPLWLQPSGLIHTAQPMSAASPTDYALVNSTATPTPSHEQQLASALRRHDVAPVALRAVSMNIRGGSWELDVTDNWNEGRNARAAQFLQLSAPDLIGFQEFETQHETYLFGPGGALKQKFAFYQSTEPTARNAIAWNSNRFELVSSGFDMLEPGLPSTPNGADLFLRSLTWVELRDRGSQQAFFAFNTHLEHRFSTVAVSGVRYTEIRRKQSEQVATLLADHNPSHLPTVLMADLNSDDLGGAYGELVTHANLTDSRWAASEASQVGVATYHGYAEPTVGLPIDFIFTNPETTVKSFAVDTQKINGRYPSDHFPLLADVVLG